MLKYRILFWQKIVRILFQFINTSATGLTHFVYTSLKMFLVNVDKDEKKMPDIMIMISTNRTIIMKIKIIIAVFWILKKKRTCQKKSGRQLQLIYSIRGIYYFHYSFKIFLYFWLA